MFTADGTLSQALKLKEALDPTPAVGGYPTDAAIDLINFSRHMSVSAMPELSTYATPTALGSARLSTCAVCS